MDAIIECEDVFITQSDTKERPLLDWITNKIVWEFH